MRLLTSRFQVHRFDNMVAVYIASGESGQTVYFSSEAADALADAIARCEMDIRQKPNFAESKFRTVSGTDSDIKGFIRNGNG